MKSSQIPGLCLAVRTDCNADFLKAFLDHHLPLCERGVVLLARRPHEDVAIVSNVLKEYEDRIRLVDFPQKQFGNYETCVALSEAVQEDPKNEFILHLDKDEFLQWPEKIPSIIHRLRYGKSKYAEARMIDRFALGGELIESSYQSRNEFDIAAPVQSQITGQYSCYDLKCYLTLAKEGVRIHSGDSTWIKDLSGMVVEHYHWVKTCVDLTKAKIDQHNSKIASAIRWREDNVVNKTEDFYKKLSLGFRPKSQWLKGWFDYPELYREMVNKAPEGATLIEVGVWCGKSLGYMAAYATLLAKKLNVVGYDQFDPTYYLGSPYPNFSSDDWINRVQMDMKDNAPCNPPALVRSSSVDAASHHEDGSVFFVFLDAGHDKASLSADIAAWKPKIMKGGFMAGHDAEDTHPGVVHALKETDLKWRYTSKRCWIVDF